MSLLLVALALTLPWLAGALWLRLWWSDPVPGGWPLALGYGYLIGVAGIALILRLEGAWGGPLYVWPPMTIYGLLTLGAAILLFRKRPFFSSRLVLGGTCSIREPIDRQCIRGQRDSGWAPGLDHLHGWRLIAFALLCLWLVTRLAGLALEVWWLPLYPWDAWSTWGLRARVWTELRELVPFVAPEVWLSEPLSKHHTLAAWSYPLTVSLIAAWPPLAMGAWNESAANLPWLGAGLALALGFYGQVRLWGASPLTALVFLWLLLSLPLLNTQVALAGYADLWQAMALGFAFMAFLHWSRGGDHRQGLLALLCLLICVAIKKEGLIWALLFLPAYLATRLRLVWLLAVAAIAGGCCATLCALGGIGFDLPGLGSVWLGPDRILLPPLGEFNFSYHDVWEPVLRHAFLYSNWHLLPYLTMTALFVAGWRVWQRPDLGWQRAGLVWVLGGLAALYLLFFWTDAYLWAVQATSINRVMLHFIPTWVFWLMTVWRETTATSLGG